MVIMFFRVGETNKEISEVVNNTERIQVVFYNGDEPDTYVEFTDGSAVNQFADFISNKDTPVLKCGYDGKIIFFLYSDVAPGTKNTVSIEFSLDPDCRHAAYMYSNALQTKELTEEGWRFLEQILETSHMADKTTN